MESELRGLDAIRALQKVSIEHLPSSRISEKTVDGVFIFVGYLPNTNAFENSINLNERKEIMVDANMKTNIPGVFAAGNCNVKKYRQVTTAVADGTIAALSAAEYLQIQK